MQKFLAVERVKIIDVPFQEGVPEIVEDLTADPPIAGVPAIPEVAEVSHQEVGRTYVEDAANQVVLSMARGLTIDYYQIKISTQLKPTLKVVREKAGARAVAPAREIVEIENVDGISLGSAVVEV